MIVKLSFNNTFLSWAIRKITNSPYSHVDIVLDEGLYLGSLPGSGVQIHHTKEDVEHFYEIMGGPASLAFAYAQLGKPYDYTGILGWLCRRKWQDDKSWFCSELVAEAINKELPGFFTESEWVTPGLIASVGRRIA